MIDKAGPRNAGARRARTQFCHLRRRQQLFDSDEFIVLVLARANSPSARWCHLDFKHIPLKPFVLSGKFGGV